MRIGLLAVVALQPCAVPSGNDGGRGPAPEPSREVIVARRDLAPGDTIEIEDLASMVLPDSMILDEDLIRRHEVVVGRVPQERLLAFEPIRSRRLAPVEAGVGVRAVLPHETVAVEIPAGQGDVASGSHVDLLVTTGHTTRTLFEGQRVVTVKEGAVVVALPADAAARVEQALLTGRPVLVLRSDQDFPER